MSESNEEVLKITIPRPKAAKREEEDEGNCHDAELNAASYQGYNREQAAQNRQLNPSPLPTSSSSSPFARSLPIRIPNVSVARELKVENMQGYKAIGTRMPVSVAVLDGVVFEEFQSAHTKHGMAGTPRYELGVTTVRRPIRQSLSIPLTIKSNGSSSVTYDIGTQSPLPGQQQPTYQNELNADSTPYAQGYVRKSVYKDSDDENEEEESDGGDNDSDEDYDALRDGDFSDDDDYYLEGERRPRRKGARNGRHVAAALAPPSSSAVQKREEERQEQAQQQYQQRQHQYRQKHGTNNDSGKISVTRDSTLRIQNEIYPLLSTTYNTAVAAAGVVVDEDDTSEWIQCDHPFCLKWRRVPNIVNMNTLPDKWVCTDNYWEPSKASCNVAEDVYNDTEEDTIQYKNTNNGFDYYRIPEGADATYNDYYHQDGHDDGDGEDGVYGDSTDRNEENYTEDGHENRNLVREEQYKCEKDNADSALDVSIDDNVNPQHEKNSCISALPQEQLPKLSLSLKLNFKKLT